MGLINLVVSFAAIVLSGVAILLSLGAKKNLEKAQEIMSGMEKQVGEIKTSVEGQVREAWKVGMDRIRTEVKMPEVAEIEKIGAMMKVFKEAGMEEEVKKMLKRSFKS